MGSCLNCQQPLEGPFCAQCGQKHIPRLSVHKASRDIGQELFHLDSKLGHTLLGLLRDPGGTVRRYVEGQRARYLHPFKFCITITALFFLWNTWIGVELDAAVGPGVDNPVLAEKTQAIRAMVMKHLNNILFLVLPLYALVLTRLFRRSGYNVAENYVLVLYVTGQVFLIGIVLSAFALVLPHTVTLAARVFVHLSYFVWAARGFYGLRGLATLRAVIAHGLYVLLTMTVVSIMSLIYLFTVLGGLP